MCLSLASKAIKPSPSDDTPLGKSLVSPALRVPELSLSRKIASGAAAPRLSSAMDDSRPAPGGGGGARRVDGIGGAGVRVKHNEAWRQRAWAAGAAEDAQRGGRVDLAR